MKFDSVAFWATYSHQFGRIPHSIEKPATEGLLGLLATDPQIERIEWAAYLLATIRNECGSNMMPIKEIKAKPGSQVWVQWQSKYWNSGFYGRGYSQLTFEGNYRQFSELLYGDDRLVKNPDLVLNPAVGYKILATGCVRGMFRKHRNGTPFKLADFLNDKMTDYVDARQIVNGISGNAYAHALRVGDYAERYEKCLRAAQAPQAQPTSVETPPTGHLAPFTPSAGYDPRVKAIQQQLLAHMISLPTWGADGKFGGETQRGIVAWEAINQRPHTGTITEWLLTSLNL